MSEGLERLEGPGGDKHGGVFSGTRIKRITLPSTLKTLGDETFLNCKILKHVLFRDGSELEEIGAGCFSGSGVEEITVPSSVTAICKEAFSKCRGLKKVLFQEGSRLERIGRRCFCASGLEEIQIPETVSTIGVGAFRNCINLATICMADSCGCYLSRADVPVSAKVVLQWEITLERPIQRPQKLK